MTQNTKQTSNQYIVHTTKFKENLTLIYSNYIFIIFSHAISVSVCHSLEDTTKIENLCVKRSKDEIS